MHGIADLGFKYCTEIQALSLEQALAGKNIAGKAQTGSGKTAAFLVAILTRYLRSPENRAKEGGNPRALVIAPTRELVIQICKDADAIGKYTGLRSLAVYGGMDYDRQRREVLSAPVDLLVATPGRLLDFVKSRVINLSNVDTLVIDEADRMLDMGFIPDVRRIMSYLPPKQKRTTMLYSATLNDAVMRLAMNWMEEPYKAEVESETNATDTVKQVVYVIQAKDKFTVLYNHIALHPDARTIVFCNRKCTTEDVYESLRIRGVNVEMLSGDVNQNKRLKVLDAFRDGEVKIVVATDVAGRGIDVKGLEYVVNFDFPYEAEDYVHRIGRTGRAGSTGIAISFADEYESCQIPDIEKYINEELKCTVIGPDDPLMKPIPPRHSKLGEVDAAAKAEVDAREAAGEEEKAAAAALVGANASTADGRPAVLKEDAPQRELPKFENALEPKAPPPDESDIYSKPVEQKEKLEEWKM
jgi:ATP-dependent RNA helicase RhlB